MRVRMKTVDDLVESGWEVSQNGHLCKNNAFVPRALIKYLGSERYVRKMHAYEWLDVDTGYMWPYDAFDRIIESHPCDCGAKYTTLPQFHSDWCSSK